MEAGASGDIAIVIQRRKGDIPIPIWLWLGGAWIDVLNLTAAQFNTYVNARLAATANPNGFGDGSDANNTYLPQKVDGLTISKAQF